MKKIKVYTIAGIIFVSVIGTLLHFAYEQINNNLLVGLFTPINESTWEHMKLLFFPMLLYGFYMHKKLKPEYPCITSALSLGILFGTSLIPIIFYTYSGILDFNFAIMDIATFFISVIIAFFTVYTYASSCKAEKYKSLLICLLCVMAVAFIIFTIYPPKIGLFTSP